MGIETSNSPHSNRCLTCGEPCRNKFCSISCSNKYWNPRTKTGKQKPDAVGRQVVTLNLICAKCGSPFSITKERRLLYGKNVPACCSRACSNAREHSVETKLKISAGARAANLIRHPNRLESVSSPVRIRHTPKSTTPCSMCGLPVPSGNKLFCSQLCREAKQRLDLYRELVSSDGARNHSILTIKDLIIDLHGYSCSICSSSSWNGRPIPLVIDHINGRAYDHRLDNLRLVCGNCDMQLDTYKSKNKCSDRTHRKGHL